MRKEFFLIFIIIGLGCKNSTKEHSILSFECHSNSDIPEYDKDIVTIVDRKTGAKIKDTAIRQIKKEVNVFKPCLKYVYVAHYRDSDGKLLSEDTIAITASGKRWMPEPHKQDELMIRYQYTNKTEKEVSEHQQAYPDFGPWVMKNTTGIIENVEELWMHPFRSNQYVFTEVAPFPHVKFPLEVGKTWHSNLSIHSGWGTWSNTHGNMTYEIVEKATKTFPFSDTEVTFYTIDAKANFPFGISKVQFWFSEKFGFLKMEYDMYTGDYLNIALVRLGF